MENTKIIVITGGSEGLGAAIARELQARNHKIWLLARHEEKLKQTHSAIISAGFLCAYQVCDVTDEKQLNGSLEHILAQDQRIDVLINNAAVWVDLDIENLDMAELVDAFKSNVFAHILATGKVAAAMKTTGGGTILNVLSTSAIDAEGDWPVYVSTKFALSGFSQSLKKKYAGSGIRIIDIFPAGINTNFYLNAGINMGPDQPWMMDKTQVAQIIAYAVSTPADLNIESLTIRRNDN